MCRWNRRYYIKEMVAKMGIINKIKEWFFGIDMMKIPRILDRVTPSVEKRLAIAEIIINSVAAFNRGVFF